MENEKKLFVGLEESNLEEFISPCCGVGLSIEPLTRICCGECGRDIPQDEAVYVGKPEIKERLIFAFKAKESVSREIIPDTRIFVCRPIKDAMNASKTMKEVAEVYEKQAAVIADALYNSLPQGTFDRLIIELMRKKLSIYCGVTRS